MSTTAWFFTMGAIWFALTYPMMVWIDILRYRIKVLKERGWTKVKLGLVIIFQGLFGLAGASCWFLAFLNHGYFR